METYIDLDLNYNNVQSDVLKKNNSQSHDIYQDVVAYASTMGIDQHKVNEIFSAIDDEEDIDEPTKLNKILDSLKNIAKGAKDYGATRDGENLGEKLDEDNGMKYDRPKSDVTILGMKPLVFALGSLILVIGIGVGIARLGKNK
jgi:hypothetical protein